MGKERTGNNGPGVQNEKDRGQSGTPRQVTQRIVRCTVLRCVARRRGETERRERERFR